MSPTRRGNTWTANNGACFNMGQMKILWESLSPYREGLKALSTAALEAMLRDETDVFRKQLIEVELERRKLTTSS